MSPNGKGGLRGLIREAPPNVLWGGWVASLATGMKSKPMLPNEKRLCSTMTSRSPSGVAACAERGNRNFPKRCGSVGCSRWDLVGPP